MELIDNLTGNLGINEEQAKGGAGLIFDLAKKKLGDTDFSRIEAVVPGMNDLLQSMPSSSFFSKAISSIGLSFGCGQGKFGDLAHLIGSFSKMGLDAGMVEKFLPIILSFVQSKGGDELKNLLAGVLK